MGKRVTLLSTSIPDPTLSGSGIFNYLVCAELLRKGVEVHAYFLVSERFLREQCDARYLSSLEKAGLRWQFVNERSYELRYAVGWDLLAKMHQFDVCRETVEELWQETGRLDGVIGFELGWAIALRNAPVPAVCILSDPLAERLSTARRSVRGVRSWLRLAVQSASVRLANLSLARRLDGRVVLGALSPYDARRVQRLGVPCRHFRWFTPEVPQLDRSAIPRGVRRGKLVALHVGALETTASREMLRYWRRELLPVLERLPFAVEMRFAGRSTMPTDLRSSRVQITWLGHVPDLAAQFVDADVFLVPMRYPVGVRTRIVSALSWGIPVVADISAAAGLPELVHGHDVLYTSSGEEIGAALEAIYHSDAIGRELGRNGRRTWEHWFHPSRNISTILEAIDIAL